MKKMFFAFLVMFFVGVSVHSQTDSNREAQWNFFSNVIPKYKSITISGSSPSSNATNNIRNNNLNWKMTIDDKYRVSFSGEINATMCGHTDNKGWSSSENNAIIINKNAHAVAYTRKGRNGVTVSYHGNGSLIWDNDKMKINLTVSGAGCCNGNFNYDVYEGIGNRERKKTDSEEFDIYADGMSSYNLTFYLQSDYVSSNNSEQLKILLSQNTLRINMHGEWSYDIYGKDIYFDYTCVNSSTIGGNTWYTASVIQKSESELITSSNDQFGEWNWNTDRTRLFLKSRNSDNKFVVLNDNGKLTWRMEMEKNTKGISESMTDSNDKLINLSMSFDGTPAQSYQFIESTTKNTEQNFIQLDYVVYNRFLGTLNKNANDILNQFKDKKIVILTYSVNNVQKTDMFMLEGLKTILELLEIK